MLKALLADITTLTVDAIVNAANSTLLGGRGVDGAIHAAAGPLLLAECKTLKGCITGNAKITGAYRLPSRYIIHTVGPVWYGGTSGEAQFLASCYTNSLLLAQKYACKSIAFPCISTGVYKYPVPAAAKIAVTTCRDFIKNHDYDCTVIFCCFSQKNLDDYRALLNL